ncbi:conserved hypothetical protein [Oenococcus oeni]|nr:conserved hypothetical protein [Oenococcus oeni]
MDCFFLWIFPVLFRGDWLWFFVIVITDYITFGCAALVFAFFYNRIYINELLFKGYQAVDNSSSSILSSKGFIR